MGQMEKKQITEQYIKRLKDLRMSFKIEQYDRLYEIGSDIGWGEVINKKEKWAHDKFYEKYYIVNRWRRDRLTGEKYLTFSHQVYNDESLWERFDRPRWEKEKRNRILNKILQTGKR